MRIALDAAAGEAGLAPFVEGALRAVSRGELEVVLVGPEKGLRAELSKRGAPASGALEVVDAAAEGAAVCAELAASGRVAGIASAGEPSAVTTAILARIKRIPGALRPALAAILPAIGRQAVLLDTGAGADAKAWHLLQFAAMGSAYARELLGAQEPRVALLSTSARERANDLVKQAGSLLRSSGLTFVGTVAAAQLALGRADVIVCDGFAGGVALELLDAGAELFVKEPQVRWWRKPAASENGRRSYASPLLGVDASVALCRRTSADAVAEAIGAATALAQARLTESLRRALDDLKQSLETTQI